MAAIVYIVLKYAAYAGWCYALFRYAGSRRAEVLGLLMGLVRQMIGIVSTPLAIILFYLPLLMKSPDPPYPVVFYAAVFIPLRCFEWYVMLAIIRSILERRGELPKLGLLQHAWVAGGIVLSILTDIPILWLMKSFNR